jgi:hypothetical protein
MGLDWEKASCMRVSMTLEALLPVFLSNDIAFLIG